MPRSRKRSTVRSTHDSPSCASMIPAYSRRSDHQISTPISVTPRQDIRGGRTQGLFLAILIRVRNLLGLYIFLACIGTGVD